MEIKELAAQLRGPGLPSATHHLTILDSIGNWHSAYFHVVFEPDTKRPCAIRSAGLQGLNDEGVRVLLDLLCEEVTRRLWRSQITIADVCDSWAGIGFEPSGFCKQLAPFENQNPMVKSVIDAAAKLFRRKYVV